MEICFQPWLLSKETWRCQVLNNNQFVLGEANIICTYCILAYPHQLQTKTRTTPHLRERVYFLKGDPEATSPWWKIRINYLRTLVWKWSIPMLSIIIKVLLHLHSRVWTWYLSKFMKGTLRNIKILFHQMQVWRCLRKQSATFLPVSSM